MDPALRSFDPAHLDTGQSLIQLLGDRSHLGHAAGQADLFAVVNDLTNRGDNCCGTAQTSPTTTSGARRDARLFSVSSQALLRVEVVKTRRGDRRGLWCRVFGRNMRVMRLVGFPA